MGLPYRVPFFIFFIYFLETNFYSTDGLYNALYPFFIKVESLFFNSIQYPVVHIFFTIMNLSNFLGILFKIHGFSKIATKIQLTAEFQDRWQDSCFNVFLRNLFVFLSYFINWESGISILDWILMCFIVVSTLSKYIFSKNFSLKFKLRGAFLFS